MIQLVLICITGRCGVGFNQHFLPFCRAPVDESARRNGNENNLANQVKADKMVAYGLPSILFFMYFLANDE